MLTRLKQRIQRMLSTEAEIAERIGLRPNMISSIGIVLAFLSCLFYAEWQINRLFLLLAAVLLLLSGFCDVLDGIVARLFHRSTSFGGFLDSLLDRYADAVVYAGLILGGLCDVFWGLIALIGSLLVSYTRARSEAIGINMEKVGFAERAERILILATASVFAYFWNPQVIVNAGVVLIAVLANLTVLQRSYHTYRELRESKDKN